MRYIPATETEVREMLAAVEAPDLPGIFDRCVPPALQLTGPLDLPAALAEGQILAAATALAEQNRPAARGSSFLGAGYYHHFSPVFVNQILLRSEFLTAYTPYQPEIAQGTLQAIWEFQTLICQLTGMDVANASLYEGGSATAEALLMADRVARGKKPRALLAASLHPEYRRTCDSYLKYGPQRIETLALLEDGCIDPVALKAALGPDVSCVVVQYPSFYGGVEDLSALAGVVHEAGALFVVVVSDLYALGKLVAPGDAGADIVCGEGQSMGVPMSLGGPALGIFATRQKLLRSMPGRLCGRTVDADGKPGYVLTLSTREQHIRRERATSNICTNQGLMATCATIHMAVMGENGVQEAARQSHLKCRYLKHRLRAIEGVSIPYSAPTFHEFVYQTRLPADELLALLRDAGIGGGVALSRWEDGEEAAHRVLVCCTEQNDRPSLDRYVGVLAAALGAE